MDELSIVQALDSVVSAIEEYEPRVKIELNQTTIDPDPDSNKFELRLVFSIIGLSDQMFSLNKTITR